MPDITRNEMNEIIKRIDENVHEVKEQVTKTNGSVRSLQLWKAKANGALCILSIIVTGIVLPLVFKYLEISLFD